MLIFDVLPDSPSIPRSDLRRYLQEMLADKVPIVAIKESLDSGEVYFVGTICLSSEITPFSILC